MTPLDLSKRAIDHTALLREEIAAFDARIEETKKDLQWLQRQAAEKRHALMLDEREWFRSVR